MIIRRTITINGELQNKGFWFTDEDGTRTINIELTEEEINKAYSELHINEYIEEHRQDWFEDLTRYIVYEFNTLDSIAGDIADELITEHVNIILSDSKFTLDDVEGFAVSSFDCAIEDYFINNYENFGNLSVYDQLDALQDEGGDGYYDIQDMINNLSCDHWFDGSECIAWR